MLSVLNSPAVADALPTAASISASMKVYRETMDAIDRRTRELLMLHRGKLQPSSYAWKEVLQLAYLHTYLQRPQVVKAICSR